MKKIIILLLILISTSIISQQKEKESELIAKCEKSTNNTQEKCESIKHKNQPICHWDSKETKCVADNESITRIR